MQHGSQQRLQGYRRRDLVWLSVCRVWLPNQDGVVRVPGYAVRPLNGNTQPEIEAGRIAYLAAAAKVAKVHDVDSLSKTDICQRFPTEALWMLGVVIHVQQWGPRELEQCLSAIPQAMPELRQDPPTRD